MFKLRAEKYVAMVMLTPAGRRACSMLKEEADAMVAEGKAQRQHTGLYIEVPGTEDPHEYATKVMYPAKRRGRPRKIPNMESVEDAAEGSD